MELEKQVCSLECAKKLKELGIKQKSLFYWIKYQDWKVKLHGEYYHDQSYQDSASTFTASELIELLPDRIDIKKDEPFNHYRFGLFRSFIVDENTKIPTFIVNYYCDTFEYTVEDIISPKFLFKNIWGTSLCNVLAETIIYLIDNKLMELSYGQ